MKEIKGRLWKWARWCCGGSLKGYSLRGKGGFKGNWHSLFLADFHIALHVPNLWLHVMEMEIWCIWMLIYLCLLNEKLFPCDEGSDTSSAWRWKCWIYVVSLRWSLVTLANAWWKHTWIWFRNVKFYVASCHFHHGCLGVQHAWKRKWCVCMTDLIFNLVAHVYRKEKNMKLLYLVGVGRISHEHWSMEIWKKERVLWLNYGCLYEKLWVLWWTKSSLE